jgi:hypothetical protein
MSDFGFVISDLGGFVLPSDQNSKGVMNKIKILMSIVSSFYGESWFVETNFLQVIPFQKFLTFGKVLHNEKVNLLCTHLLFD